MFVSLFLTMIAISRTTQDSNIQINDSQRDFVRLQEERRELRVKYRRLISDTQGIGQDISSFLEISDSCFFLQHKDHS